MAMWSWGRLGLMLAGIGLASLALIVVGLIVVGGVIGALMACVGLLGLAWIGYGVFRLRRVDTSGWLITWDIPEPLQFSAYIGQQQAFSFAEHDPPTTVAEQQWRAWWHALPERLFSYHAQMDDLLRTNADLPPLELWRAVSTTETFDYDPPDFDSLSDQPALRALCRHHWPDFRHKWEAEKPAIVELMRRQGRAVREEQIVRACLRATGRPTSAPFFLRLDFVRWPAAYQQRRSDQHVVLGVEYLEASATERLREVIAASVTKLI